MEFALFRCWIPINVFFGGGESKKFFRLEYISSNLDFHEFLLFAVELQFLKVGDILALRCDVLFFVSSIGRFLDFDEFLLSAIAVSINVFWKLKKFLLYIEHDIRQLGFDSSLLPCDVFYSLSRM